MDSLTRRCCINRGRTEFGCAPQQGLSGEIEEFVDEKHFACDARLQQNA